MRYSMKRRVLLIRWVGFLLIVIGILLFYFLMPIVAQLGLFRGWIFVWSLTGLMGLGGLLFLNLQMKSSLKVMVVTLILLNPWSLIFFLPLPSNSHGLVAVFIAGIIGLLIRQYYLKHKPDKQKGNSQHSDN